MTDNPHTFEATVESFDELVIEASRQRPVVVDFWAAWCAPCRSLMPILADLAERYAGKFHLVKVNSDEQQELAQRFAVRSLPTVKIFRDGEVVDEFMGALPESAVREYIDRHIVRESDALRQRARELLKDDDWDGAIRLLRKAIEVDPDVALNYLELASVLAAGHRFDEAEQVLNEMDPLMRTRHQEQVDKLRKRIQYDRMAAEDISVSELEQRIADDENDLDARLRLAAHYLSEDRHEEALEQFLEIMKRDRAFRDDAGRKGLLDVFELLGNNHPLVNEYRKKMALLMY